MTEIEGKRGNLKDLKIISDYVWPRLELGKGLLGDLERISGPFRSRSLRVKCLMELESMCLDMQRLRFLTRSRQLRRNL